jgi:hypothetical protein
MGLGGGPIVELFTTGVVLFPADAGAVDGDGDGDGVNDGDGVDGVDVDGGDSVDGGWPVDGENGTFGLNCAKAMLIELAIVAIPIAIIVDIKMMTTVF